MSSIKANLMEAERKAAELFSAIESRNLMVPGKTENELNTEIFDLAYEMYGIKKYWHKRIVRTGKNTLYVHPDNHQNMFDLDKSGQKREWILEIHFVDKEKEIGGFFEQLLT